MATRRLSRFLLLVSGFLVASTVVLSIGISQAFQLEPFERNIADKKVAAFYYGWYSNTTNYSQSEPFEIIDNGGWRHWNDVNWQPPVNACSVYTPVHGWYDSADPSLVETHIEQAQWAGIDAFVASYWGKNGFEMRNFINMLEVARHVNASMKFTLYFEIFMAGLDKKPVDEARAFIVEEFTHIHGVFTDPRYEHLIWHEDGKPVLFSYVVQAVSKDTWIGAINELAARGISFFLVADRPGRDPAFNANFQANHQYDVYYPTYHGLYNHDFLQLRRTAVNSNQVFCAGVSPGYNDDPVFRGNPILARGVNGSTYRDSWNKALALKPDWITITSWNEWHEATEIEPSIENGDLALNQTKQFITEFKTGNLQDLQPPVVSAWTWAWDEVVALAGAWIVAILVIVSFARGRIVAKGKHPAATMLAAMLLILLSGAVVAYGVLSIGGMLNVSLVMAAEPYPLLAPVIAALHALPLALVSYRIPKVGNAR